MIFFPEKLFYASPSEFGLEAEEVRYKTADGVELFAWYLPQRGPTLLFLHGNAGNISHRLPIAKGWFQRGYSMLLVDYRGFGRSQGELGSERDLYADADAAYQLLTETWKIPAERIVLYGESIGCAGAVDLALRKKAGALVLMAPFTTLADLAKVHYEWMPSAFLSHYRFDNESKIGKVSLPLFIQQGTEDEICPVSMGRRLFEKAPQPKEAWWIPGGHHNDLRDVAGADFWDKPASFLRRHRLE